MFSLYPAGTRQPQLCGRSVLAWSIASNLETKRIDLPRCSV
jgi:hypothetical protein